MAKHLEIANGMRCNEMFHFHSRFHIKEHTRNYFFQELLTIGSVGNSSITTNRGFISCLQYFANWEQRKLVWFLTLPLRPICFSGTAAVRVAPSLLLPLARDITVLSSSFIRHVHLCPPKATRIGFVSRQATSTGQAAPLLQKCI